MWWSDKPYVSVAQRREKACKEVAKRQGKGEKVSPVQIDGNKIAKTFWGKAWCDNLNAYSDYANRLPRGRSYVRNGCVVDLQVEAGRVTALVCGSSLYKIKIGITPLNPQTWAAVKRECAGEIGSLIELLQGKLSQRVMQIITRPGAGLFPKPAEIELDCSCPDWADLCKHVAAALYGVGARLDEQPELLFVLRKVDHLELITQAADLEAIGKGAGQQKTIASDDLSDVFGIDLDAPEETKPAPPAKKAAPNVHFIGQRPTAAAAPKRVKRGKPAKATDASAPRSKRKPKPPIKAVKGRRRTAQTVKKR